jgi:hypothetical protein
MSKAFVILLLAAALAIAPATISNRGGVAAWSNARAQAAHSMRASVIGSAGAPGSSANYRANGTLGQSTPIGIGAAASKKVYAGFWGRPWSLTGVDENPVVYRNALFQNYPNPFNPSTTIEYSLEGMGAARIVIFSVDGRRIRTLDGGVKPPGAYRAIWDGKNDHGQSVATGIYFDRLEAGRFSAVKKMILIR